MPLQNFGKERARRFANAIQYCPYARLNELIPALFMAFRADIAECRVIDLGAGTGFLSGILSYLAKEVILVDRSAHMAKYAKGFGERFDADLERVYLQEHLRSSADILVSLASLHHIYEEIDTLTVDDAKTVALQKNTLINWTRLLKPGGKLIIIDVCVPQIILYPQRDTIMPIDMEQYYISRHDELKRHVFPVKESFIHALVESDLNHALAGPLSELSIWDYQDISLLDIAQLQAFGSKIDHNHLIPVDFFNEVVDQFSIDRHIAYFPRESQIQAAIDETNLQHTFIGVLPTPWKFRDHIEAVWFVKELFGWGAQSVASPKNMRSSPDYEVIRRYVEEYLGIYTGDDGYVYVCWQLMFIYGEKP